MLASDEGLPGDTPEDGQFDDAETDTDTSSTGEDGEEDKEEQTDAGDTWFNPPLYRQRYSRVADILGKENVKTVVDFGCSEGKVLPLFKSLDSMEEIVGVDLDRGPLTSACYLTKPLLADYLVKRSRPLRIRLLCGDAGTYDSRLNNFEAVTMIEVVEHLYPDTLEKVAKNVFVNIRPRIVVITTPNSEYNVLFPGMTGFRHWDHKFEWTRKEFQDWCSPLAAMHGYTVEYSGVGSPPEGEAHLGDCSQIAMFRLSGNWSPEGGPNSGESLPYETITECVHPHEECVQLETTVVMATNYYLKVLTDQQKLGSQEEEATETADSFHYDFETNITKVSLKFMLSFSRFRKLSIDTFKYRDILESEGFTLSEDGHYILHSPPEEEESTSSDPEDEEFQSSETCDPCARPDLLSENNWTENWDDT